MPKSRKTPSARFENGLNQKGRWAFQSKKLHIHFARFAGSLVVQRPYEPAFFIC